MLATRITLVGEATDPVLVAKVAFVVLAGVLKGDLLADLEELGQLRVLLRFVHYRRLDHEKGRVRGEDRLAC